MLSAI